jgi:Animal haem peroxidase
MVPMPRFASTHAVELFGHCGFGRLFTPRQSVLPDAMLVALAETMNEGMGGDLLPSQKAMPAAGYTYLGQFIDHDLSSDRRLFGEPSQVPVNFRTPRFDLDSLYGQGPKTDGDLYDADRLLLNGALLDLGRGADGRAHIKDQRNDSNRIVSQMHVAFARFHNRVVDQLSPGPERLAQARDIVRLHYQWIVLHDFLPVIVGRELVDSIASVPGGDMYAGLKLFKPDQAAAQIPLEFSAAAFRFGHSMVRGAYQLNASSALMLTFDIAQPTGNDADDLRGFRPLPARLAVDWQMFFNMPGSAKTPQQARPIDTLVVKPLYQLPFKIALDETPKGRLLPYRNLHRGEIDLHLPTGQEVARELRRLQVPGSKHNLLGIEIPIEISNAMLMFDPDDIGGTGISKANLEQCLNDEAPLWYYILKESEHFHHGLRLGPVGGRIVAEVVIGLMLSDQRSALRTGWKPKQGEYGCSQDGAYGIVELLSYAAPE